MSRAAIADTWLGLFGPVALTLIAFLPRIINHIRR